LDPGTLAEAIRFQEILHATVGRDRAAASIGIYPAEQLSGPIRYTMEPLPQVSFVPLDGDGEVSAAAFFREHPLAARYGALGRDGDRCLTLRDSEGTILSLPPILNARGAGEARVGDRVLLLEATGTRARSVYESLGLLVLVFAARGFVSSAVATQGPGAHRQDGRAILRSRALFLPRDLLDAVAGTEISARTVARLAREARLGIFPAARGWRIEAAPWRPDLLGPIDVVEEIVLAGGVRQEDALMAPSRTTGGRRPEVRFRRRFLPLLLGLGYQPLYHPVLTARSSIDRLPGLRAIRIANPPSAEFGAVRPNLLVSLLPALAANVRHGYPQRICEAGPVLQADAEAETGARTAHHVAAVLAADDAGFATAAALGEYLLRSIDVVGVRESADLPGTISGRAAQIHVAGVVVAELGEIHPHILGELKVVVPVTWAELDLTALWPLVEVPPSRAGDPTRSGVSRGAPHLGRRRSSRGSS
jgi:phenylalanyl-tRNA synthetase beta chain